jgi:hypothetical protein
MDIPRLKGVPYLEPGTPIYVEDLEAWEKQAGVTVGPGDAVFIRTGRWVRRAMLDLTPAAFVTSAAVCSEGQGDFPTFGFEAHP